MSKKIRKRPSRKSACIPVIDLFAGPGGLGEGFDSLRPAGRRPGFEVVLSIECDPWAHRTLELRSFFRQFPRGKAPEAYYDYLRGKLKREELFAAYPLQAKAAAAVARKAKLGEEDPDVVDGWIRQALGPAGKTGQWVLVGGPPCQAYSLVGRARRSRESREKFESDERHYLYKEYLRILHDHQPAVFVMENVKGILSASLGGERIFGEICDDLSAAGYDLHALGGEEVKDLALSWMPSAFLVRAEDHGVPQCRHRVFIVGIRRELHGRPRSLAASAKTITVSHALRDLPSLSSSLSARGRGSSSWEEARSRGILLAGGSVPRKTNDYPAGSQFTRSSRKPSYAKDWFYDRRLRGVVNHETRGHMADDIARYAFAAEFARRNGRSPGILDFPRELLPNHRNVRLGSGDIPFADRFRVQVAAKPASTVTSHIAKDGHYYIHPEPLQARSLTVREAARLQTFPDNYFFEGPRTEQYRQAGNAVPPLLASKIATAVSGCFG